MANEAGWPIHRVFVLCDEWDCTMFGSRVLVQAHGLEVPLIAVSCDEWDTGLFGMAGS